MRALTRRSFLQHASLAAALASPAAHAAAPAADRQAPGVYRLSGTEIERLAVMTDWSNYEAVERFERILRGRGISAKLEEMGVELGDTILIGDMELEWQ